VLRAIDIPQPRLACFDVGIQFRNLGTQAVDLPHQPMHIGVCDSPAISQASADDF
jgi:hypothetical protein